MILHFMLQVGRSDCGHLKMRPLGAVWRIYWIGIYLGVKRKVIWLLQWYRWAIKALARAEAVCVWGSDSYKRDSKAVEWARIGNCVWRNTQGWLSRFLVRWLGRWRWWFSSGRRWIQFQFFWIWGTKMFDCLLIMRSKLQWCKQSKMI